MSLPIRVILLPFISMFIGCASSQQHVIVHKLPNYDPQAIHQLLFLNFMIRRNEPGKPEQVRLTNAIIGNGEMKDIGDAVHTPYQIKLFEYTNDHQPPKEKSVEHPLFRSIEIANIDGTFDRKLTSDQEGHFSFRLPYTNTLTKIELYSITPDQGKQKIYTLPIKP